MPVPMEVSIRATCPTCKKEVKIILNQEEQFPTPKALQCDCGLRFMLDCMYWGRKVGKEF